MTRKILLTIIAGLLLTGASYGAADPDDASAPPQVGRATAGEDTTAQDLSVLRKKLSRVKREMDLLIKDMVSNVSVPDGVALKDFASDVNVDILQSEKNVIVRADLPGMEKDKINITLEGGKFLKISGAREVLKSQSTPGVVRQERFFGSFEKTVELPCEVESSGIDATYKDGVLEIAIPKKAKGKEDKVKISVK